MHSANRARITMKKLIRKMIRSQGFDVVKTEQWYLKHGKDYYNGSYYETPTGKYYLPEIRTDGVANAIKRGAIFEEEIVEIARQYIKEGSTVLDVGANFGQMTVLFSRMVGNTGLVYSFEAEPTVTEYLRKNIEINNCDNVKCVFGAVHNEDGKTLIFPEIDFKRFGTYGSYGLSPTAKVGREIRTVTIDSLNVETPISFMKVDIQGADLFALQGARRTIARHRMAIVFEYEEQFQNDFGTCFQDYVDFVDRIHYRFVKTIRDINYVIVPK
jgi:FkbM family methyltransferase